MTAESHTQVGRAHAPGRRLTISIAFAASLAVLGACGGGDNHDGNAAAGNAADAGTAGTAGNADNTGKPRVSAAAGRTASRLAAGDAVAAADDTAGWVTVPVPADPLLENLQIPADAATRGMWSGVHDWPLNGLHATVLPSGKVLSYGSTPDGVYQDAKYLDLWNPETGFVPKGHYTSWDGTRQNTFCSAATYLGDGRLLITGGNGEVTSNVYTPATNTTFTLPANLADERWYATLITLPDGSPLIMGGMVPYRENMVRDPDLAVAQGLMSMTPEVYQNGAWRSLFGAYSREAFGPDYLRGSYPRAWVMPSGRVFGVSAERLWSLDPAGNGTIVIHGAFKTPPNSAVADPPNVGSTNTAVMVDIGKVLVAGGNGSNAGDGHKGSRQATVIDMNSGTPVLTEQGRMAFPRRYPNAVVLPDGKVVVTGGTMLANDNGVSTVYAAEIWDPATGTWRLGPDAAIFRGYHSNSLLLPNGTVLSLGGGTPGPVTNLNAEVYYPPQLFRTVNGVGQLAPRPVLTAINGLSHAHGAALQIDMANAAPIQGLVLIGVSSGTHSFNSGQRRIPVAFTQNAIRLTATVPNANLTPPGYYQVVAIDANGVPSRGTIVAIGQGVGAPPVQGEPYDPPDLSAPIAAPVVGPGVTATYRFTAVTGVRYSWDFGDGTAATPFSATASASHAFARPGVYTVTLTARAANGTLSRRTLTQAVATPSTSRRPNASASLAMETRVGASTRLWVSNPDNDSVSVLDMGLRARVAEVPVGAGPRSVAMGADNRVWVANKDDATLSILSPTSLSVMRTIQLPRASQPHGIAFAPGGARLYVALEATGQLLKIDPASGAIVGTASVGPRPRHLSISADGGTVYVSRFVTPPLPGESTASVDVRTAGGEVAVVHAGPMTVARTIVLRHSNLTDTEVQGSGIPNYLAAPVIAPDGKSAWVPSKQDNVRRGKLRNGQNLDFQNTVRAISSRIDLTTFAEDLPRRMDHDNASVASVAAFHPSGVYLFVALETSRQVAVMDAIRGSELFRIEVGRAPQGLKVTPDGRTLFVHNFMDRSVSAVDLSPLVLNGELRTLTAATVDTVAIERLTPQVVLGKKLFYDARDPRLARDSYMSCASCHNDAGGDGRVWDMTGLGEGLRRTVALKGRGGLAQGFLHWSGNFDEVQDFENQIRGLAGGTGLMTPAHFSASSNPLGTRKTGRSHDLDALAAYVTSENTFAHSPYRAANGMLTGDAVPGKAVFAAEGCAGCHGGTGFTRSADGTALKDIGTLRATSGTRSGAKLTGIDVPTLRDVWLSGPYLHDGRAPTLAAAIQAHAGNTVQGDRLRQLAAYLQQIGREEPAP
mgnify:CR=1 FL=1